MITFDEISSFICRAFFEFDATSDQEKEWKAVLLRLAETVISFEDKPEKRKKLAKIFNALDFDWGGAIPDYTAAYKFFGIKEDSLDAEVLEVLIQEILVVDELKRKNGK